MTTSRDDRAPRFERELRSFLDAEAGLDHPVYLADVLLRSATMRQRPAWTFPARALPGNAAFVQRPVSLMGGPLRLVAISAVLLLVLATIAVVAGSRPTTLLAPYGPAANGRVVYSSADNIWTVDPATGNGTVIVGGAAMDWDPVWSRDGTQVAFHRFDPETEDGRLLVAAADGTGLRAVTTPLPNIGEHAFSPDGASIAFIAGEDTRRTLWISDVASGSVRHMDLGMPVADIAWIPGGSTLVVAGSPKATVGGGLFIVDTATGELHSVIDAEPGTTREVPAVSPDGTLIAYAESDLPDVGVNTYRVRVVGIDGSGDRLLPMPTTATFQDRPAWSNDGTRLAVIRGYGSRNQDVAVAVVPADGSGTGVETDHGSTLRSVTGCCDTLLEWSPDDTALLVQPEDVAGILIPQVLVDPATGVVTPTSWTAVSVPSWQRVAP